MVRIKITQELIDLLNCIKINQTEKGCEIIKNDLFYISDVISTSMMAWGKNDNYIKDSEKSFDGKRWDEDLENKAWDTYDYIVKNLDEIISIVLSNAKTGIKPGVYYRKTKEPGLWNYDEHIQ
jgi:hypothetical protein